MICPLLSSASNDGYTRCQSSGCAWWDAIRQCCAVIPLCFTDVAHTEVGPILDSDVELSGGVNE